MNQYFFPHSEMVEVNISSEGLAYLLNAVSESFKRDNEGHAIKSENGLYGQSSFYEGKGKYFMTNTCNTWVAQALARAGVPIREVLTLTAESVMRQTRAAIDDYSCCP